MFKPRRAFTLIELLVVIAIIAILAAILFPVFAQAREKGRQTTCVSNTKQIASAVTMYAQDYDETFPFSDNFAVIVPGSPVQNQYQYWGDAIAPYVRNGGKSIHPTLQGGTGNYGPYQRCPSQPEFWSGYAYNIELGYYPFGQLNSSPVPTPPNRLGIKMAMLNRPADIFAVIDNSVVYAWLRNNLQRTDLNSQIIHYRYSPQKVTGAYPSCAAMYNWPESATVTGNMGSYAGVPSARHAGGVNAAFADGHAKWVRLGAEFCKLEHGFIDAP